MNRYRIYDMNEYPPKTITEQTYGKNDGRNFEIMAEKDGEWVKYEDVKGLELQIMTLTEQLSKMKWKQSKQFDIDDNGFYEKMTGKLLDHIIL